LAAPVGQSIPFGDLLQEAFIFQSVENSGQHFLMDPEQALQSVEGEDSQTFILDRMENVAVPRCEVDVSRLIKL
jgi:hypothetical protein